MIRDLLNPSSGFLELREDGRGVVVAGISEVQAKKTSEVSIWIHVFHPRLVSVTLLHFICHFKRFYYNSCHGTFDACRAKKGCIVYVYIPYVSRPNFLCQAQNSLSY